MCDVEELLTYVAQLQAEHQKLQAVVKCIQVSWQELGQSVIHALLELRKTLSMHFNQEDFTCFEEAACRFPKLGPEVNRLEREHVELLAELESIIRQWRIGMDVQPAFDAFVAHLQAHEYNENCVLQKAFGIELEL